MGQVACQIIINCGAKVRGAAAGFAERFEIGKYPRAAATRLNVTNEELCRFAQTVLTAREPIVIEPEYAAKIKELGDVALKLAADMDIYIRCIGQSIQSKQSPEKLADRAMNLADAQCDLFGDLVDEYGGGS